MPTIKSRLFTLFYDIRPLSSMTSHPSFQSEGCHTILNYRILVPLKTQCKCPLLRVIPPPSFSVISPCITALQFFDIFFLVCLLIYCLFPNISLLKRGKMKMFFAVSQGIKFMPDIEKVLKMLAGYRTVISSFVWMF